MQPNGLHVTFIHNGDMVSCNFVLDFVYQVLRNQGYDGRASDIWSCGVILFVLMAGYMPFDEPNLISLYQKVSKNPKLWLIFRVRTWLKPFYDNIFRFPRLISLVPHGFHPVQGD